LEAQAELRRIASALNLTPEQREKLRPIVNDEGEQLRAVRLDERMTPEQKRAKVLEIRESFRPKIAEVLTPEQQEKWNEDGGGIPTSAPRNQRRYGQGSSEAAVEFIANQEKGEETSATSPRWWMRLVPKSVPPLGTSATPWLRTTRTRMASIAFLARFFAARTSL